jgi:uncharacterized protein with PQ loop repeat
MNRKTTEAIGLVAGFMTTFALFPQVIKLWRMWPKPATGVATLTYAFGLVGVALWIVYGVRIRSLSVTWWNVVVIILTTFILTYKLLYG